MMCTFTSFRIFSSVSTSCFLSSFLLTLQRTQTLSLYVVSVHCTCIYIDKMYIFCSDVVKQIFPIFRSFFFIRRLHNFPNSRHLSNRLRCTRSESMIMDCATDTTTIHSTNVTTTYFERPQMSNSTSNTLPNQRGQSTSQSAIYILLKSIIIDLHPILRQWVAL